MAKLGPSHKPASGRDAAQADAEVSVPRRARDVAGLISLIACSVVWGPSFLISCLVADIGSSFTFGALELGIILSVFNAGAAVGSLLAGMWVDRIGARTALVIATTFTAVSALGSGLSEGWHMLVLMFGVGGCSCGIAGPAAVRLLVSVVARNRLAVAFAIRQSAAPFSAILVGLFAATALAYVGWRATFFGFAVLAAVIAVLSVIWAREGTVFAKGANSGRLRTETVVLLLGAAALMGATVSAFSGFVVATGIAIGMSPEGAAALLVAASIAAIVARIASGWAADKRSGGHLIRVAGLLLLGSIGCAAISLVQTPALFIPAVIAVSATAWSSNALYTYAVVKRQAHAPAKASGLIQIGNFVGSAIGPFIFGLTMEQATMSVAWLLLAGWLLLASGVVLLARRTFGVPAAPPG